MLDLFIKMSGLPGTTGEADVSPPSNAARIAKIVFLSGMGIAIGLFLGLIAALAAGFFEIGC